MNNFKELTEYKFKIQILIVLSYIYNKSLQLEIKKVMLLYMCCWSEHKKTMLLDFLGGPVVIPANVGDMGSVPGPGRSHMPRGNKAHVPQQLSLALELALQNKRSPCNEKLPHCHKE